MMLCIVRVVCCWGIMCFVFSRTRRQWVWYKVTCCWNCNGNETRIIELLNSWPGKNEMLLCSRLREGIYQQYLSLQSLLYCKLFLYRFPVMCNHKAFIEIVAMFLPCLFCSLSYTGYVLLFSAHSLRILCVKWHMMFKNMYIVDTEYVTPSAEI